MDRSDSGEAADNIIIRDNLQELYSDIYTPEVLVALELLSAFNKDVKHLMKSRIERREQRISNKEHIEFLPSERQIPGTDIKVQDAREGKFEGAEIPVDLQRQWIQGTGPAAKPNAPVESSLRNVAYALLSGADGWMFDGEDALGQITTMSLDNQRSLKLATRRDRIFLTVAEQIALEMNKWGASFFGKPIVEDWKEQLDFTTLIFRARGLHLDDRHFRLESGEAWQLPLLI